MDGKAAKSLCTALQGWTLEKPIGIIQRKPFNGLKQFFWLLFKGQYVNLSEQLGSLDAKGINNSMGHPDVIINFMVNRKIPAFLLCGMKKKKLKIEKSVTYNMRSFSVMGINRFKVWFGRRSNLQLLCGSMNGLGKTAKA